MESCFGVLEGKEVATCVSFIALDLFSPGPL